MNKIYKTTLIISFAIFLHSCFSQPPTIDYYAIPKYSDVDSILHSNNLIRLNDQLENKQIFLEVEPLDEYKITDTLDKVSITFKNTSDSSYLIQIPELHVNTIYSITNGKDYFPEWMICPPVNLNPTYVLLKAKDSVQFAFNRILADGFIYSKKKISGNYDLSFSYSGFFKTKDGKFILKYITLKSDKESFSIK